MCGTVGTTRTHTPHTASHSHIRQSDSENLFRANETYCKKREKESPRNFRMKNKTGKMPTMTMTTWDFLKCFLCVCGQTTVQTDTIVNRIQFILFRMVGHCPHKWICGQSNQCDGENFLICVVCPFCEAYPPHRVARAQCPSCPVAFIYICFAAIFV